MIFSALKKNQCDDVITEVAMHDMWLVLLERDFLCQDYLLFAQLGELVCLNRYNKKVLFKI